MNDVGVHSMGVRSVVVNGVGARSLVVNSPGMHSAVVNDGNVTWAGTYGCLKHNFFVAAQR
jgi:hypothetical protein